MGQPDFYYLCCSISLLFSLFSLITLACFIPAPYGKHSQKGWGCQIPAKIAWTFFESPNLVHIVLALAFLPYERLPLGNALILGMYGLHYLNRTIIYPLRTPSGAKPVPCTIMGSAFLYCILNGYIQTAALTRLEYHDVDALVYAGGVIFLGGFVLNIHSDNILKNLRKPGESGYKIPRGGLFEYVSGANFFAQIIEWSGYALAARNLGSAVFLISTVSNIGPRAASHHRWYLQKFREDYPKERKALIPFIY